MRLPIKFLTHLSLFIFSAAYLPAIDTSYLYITRPHPDKAATYVHERNPVNRSVLISHCQAKKTIWLRKYNASENQPHFTKSEEKQFQCMKAEGDEFGVSLWLDPPFNEDLSLISLKRFPSKTNWQKRSATLSETKIIKEFSEFSTTSLRSTFVVVETGILNRRTFASFPIENFAPDEDGFRDTKYGIIELSANKPEVILETFYDRPEFIDDVDGDGIPEVMYAREPEGLNVNVDRIYPVHLNLAYTSSYE